MYYNLDMKVLYSKRIIKAVNSRRLPKEVWTDFRDALESLARTRNFRLFDIKRLISHSDRVFYRMRIRRYRALFHMDDKHIYVEDIGPRGSIYKP